MFLSKLIKFSFSVPAKQYHISKVSNKIYDITERKKFCSTDCFRGSNYIKEQLFTSPLWLRDHEEIPDFQLLRPHRSEEYQNLEMPEFSSLSLKEDDHK